MEGHPTTDCKFGSDKVYRLNSSNFQSFLNTRGTVMVVFYGDTDAPRFNKVKQAVAEAADRTKRAKHAYVTLNCLESPDICEAQQIDITPVLRVYSKGDAVSSTIQASFVTADRLVRAVERAPFVADVTLCRSKNT